MQEVTSENAKRDTTNHVGAGSDPGVSGVRDARSWSVAREPAPISARTAGAIGACRRDVRIRSERADSRRQVHSLPIKINGTDRDNGIDRYNGTDWEDSIDRDNDIHRNSDIDREGDIERLDRDVSEALGG